MSEKKLAREKGGRPGARGQSQPSQADLRLDFSRGQENRQNQGEQGKTTRANKTFDHLVKGLWCCPRSRSVAVCWCFTELIRGIFCFTRSSYRTTHMLWRGWWSGRKMQEIKERPNLGIYSEDVCSATKIVNFRTRQHIFGLAPIAVSWCPSLPPSISPKYSAIPYQRRAHSIKQCRRE